MRPSDPCPQCTQVSPLQSHPDPKHPNRLFTPVCATRPPQYQHRPTGEPPLHIPLPSHGPPTPAACPAPQALHTACPSPCFPLTGSLARSRLLVGCPRQSPPRWGDSSPLTWNIHPGLPASGLSTPTCAHPVSTCPRTTCAHTFCIFNQHLSQTCLGPDTFR